jgi:transposase
LFHADPHDEAPDTLSPRLGELTVRTGRPSVPPETLIRALLPQAFFSIRTERQLTQQRHDSLPCRWFAGLAMGARVTSVPQGACSQAWRGSA